jgi:hypothetical protein
VVQALNKLHFLKANTAEESQLFKAFGSNN